MANQETVPTYLVRSRFQRPSGGIDEASAVCNNMVEAEVLADRIVKRSDCLSVTIFKTVALYTNEVISKITTKKEVF